MKKENFPDRESYEMIRYGVYQNRQTRTYWTHDKSGAREISNFLMRILFRIGYASDEQLILFLENKHGAQKIIRIKKREFAHYEDFQKVLKKAGDFTLDATPFENMRLYSFIQDFEFEFENICSLPNEWLNWKLISPKEIEIALSYLKKGVASDNDYVLLPKDGAIKIRRIIQGLWLIGGQKPSTLSKVENIIKDTIKLTESYTI